MVNEAEKYKAEDEAAASRITAKNGLETYGASLSLSFLVARLFRRALVLTLPALSLSLSLSRAQPTRSATRSRATSRTSSRRTTRSRSTRPSPRPSRGSTPRPRPRRRSTRRSRRSSRASRTVRPCSFPRRRRRLPPPPSYLALLALEPRADSLSLSLFSPSCSPHDEGVRCGRRRAGRCGRPGRLPWCRRCGSGCGRRRALGRGGRLISRFPTLATLYTAFPAASAPVPCERASESTSSSRARARKLGQRAGRSPRAFSHLVSHLEAHAESSLTRARDSARATRSNVLEGRERARAIGRGPSALSVRALTAASSPCRSTVGVLLEFDDDVDRLVRAQRRRRDARCAGEALPLG